MCLMLHYACEKIISLVPWLPETVCHTEPCIIVVWQQSSWLPWGIRQKIKQRRNCYDYLEIQGEVWKPHFGTLSCKISAQQKNNIFESMQDQVCQVYFKNQWIEVLLWWKSQQNRKYILKDYWSAQFIKKVMWEHAENVEKLNNHANGHAWMITESIKYLPVQ